MNWLESGGIMLFSKHRLLPVFIAALAISSAAQTKDLTRDQYMEAIGDAYHADDNAYPLRKTIVDRTFNYKGQVLTLTNEIEEWTANNIERRVVVVSSEGKRQKTEVIWIDGDFYCRRNGGQWMLESQNCLLTKSWGLVTKITQTYTSEESGIESQKVKVLRAYYTGRDLDNGPMAYFRENYWIGKDGMIIRVETKRGLMNVKSPMWSRNEIFTHRSTDVKIERPIPKQ